MSTSVSYETPHFDTIYTFLPTSLKSGIDDLLSRATRESTVRHTLDQLVRFALRKESSEEDFDSREEWNVQREKVDKALTNLRTGTEKGKKRTREEEADICDSDSKAKKLKLCSDAVGDADEPIFSLHALSATAPVRKKVNITVYQKSIRLTHATSGAEEASFPLTSLTRAFLISTPGKSKPHWTVIILTNAEQNQIIFGVDAVPPSLTTTTHPASPQINPKGTEAKPALTQFLSHLSSHVSFQEPSTSIFRSAAGEPFLDAYLRAKDGHLLFFKDGILFGEKKPCMWIGMEEIDSVRSLSATGRTFSLFVKRSSETTDEDGGGDGGGDDDDEKYEGEETEFSLIDGKNQDPVARWVQENRPRFGISQRSTTRVQPQNGADVDELAADDDDDDDEDTPEKEKAAAAEDSEDGDDSDFEGDSESDGGSATSGSSTEENSGREEEEGEEEEEEGQSGSDDDDDADRDSLDPSKHPLLREGAVPRMSRKTLDAVVDMVERDLMGGSVMEAQAEYDDELEDVDELED